MDTRLCYAVYSGFFDSLQAASGLDTSSSICRNARALPPVARLPAMLAVEHYSRRAPKLSLEDFVQALLQATRR